MIYKKIQCSKKASIGLVSWVKEESLVSFREEREPSSGMKNVLGSVNSNEEEYCRINMFE